MIKRDNYRYKRCGCSDCTVTVMFGVSPIVTKMASGKMQVVQATKKIEQGQVISAEDITKVEIGSYGVKDGVILCH